eukprot:6039341-Prymnesium_polylepis.1
MSSTSLLDGARSLQSLIAESADREPLPPVPRSVHQIRDDAAALANKHERQPLDAPTNRFLAAQGIAASELDPQDVGFEKPDHARQDWTEYDEFDDMDDFVERSREELLDFALRSVMDLATEEHDRMGREYDPA